MNELEKRVRLVSLLRIYGGLLSPSQKEILTSHLLYDLSIGEISEERGISRAAAFDAIKKGDTRLEEIEKAVGFLSLREGLSTRLKKALSLDDDGLRKEIEGIKEDIDNGI